MPPDKSKQTRRMVVEEVDIEKTSETPEMTESSEHVEEIKEKVGELQDITEHISDDIEKSTEVQEEIVQAAEKVEPKIEDFAPVGSGIKNGPSPLIILIPGVLLLGALLGGIYFYQKNISSIPEITPTPVSIVLPTTVPTASPSAKLILSKYPVNVQNGSGIPGVAGDAKSLLTKAGFSVSATGNADSYDYSDTIIKVRSDVPAEFVTKLTSTLSGIYTVAGKIQDLPDTSKDLVVVIVGSSKSQ
ncbi:MAG: hypothetical protein UU16_C0021G0025 [Candidatus Woesebacteria bacterium GW2011_GWA2_40_7]|uniref:LytR/CpsA/Psr regulator C-terminal domain-containing protein n=3 Tax=Candidatus Woeseibacteriota TaxID=1752722 RepID=A0A0G1FV57_9BACT|nr:MAG: hypothetical protein UU16_C0021G0025 [Candidatus Woesebacteria bacterium GW2011_GWA2_40_7]KKS90648.1 MAG: hypothetical protein UV66_C0001G0005 [Candidatus Woesebacteria bacterium GW2011_GWA1_43_12]